MVVPKGSKSVLLTIHFQVLLIAVSFRLLLESARHWPKIHDKQWCHQWGCCSSISIRLIWPRFKEIPTGELGFVVGPTFVGNEDEVSDPDVFFCGLSMDKQGRCKIMNLFWCMFLKGVQNPVIGRIRRNIHKWISFVSTSNHGFMCVAFVSKCTSLVFDHSESA